MKPRPRKTAKLSKSVHRQLNSYALAAGAAGVSVLALAQPTEAKIKYTPTHIVIEGNQQYNLDLNHDGIADFVIQNAEHIGFCARVPGFADLSPRPAVQGNGVMAPYSGFASALYRGAQIGHSQKFQSSFNPMVEVASCFGVRNDVGPWVNVSNRYLGLSFKIKGKTHYGWARLSVQVGYVYIRATLTGFAYEDIAGKSINAGQTHGRADDLTDLTSGPRASIAIPITDTRQLASLGMLALGAPGLSIWRRESVGARP